MALAELLRRDIHPAEVLLPDGELLREARVFVTSERLLVWQKREGQVRQVLALDLVMAPPPSRASLNGGSLELGCWVDGEEQPVYVNPGRGCGCGSPLKALAPPVGWKAAA